MAAADVPISILLEKLQKLLDPANGRLIIAPRFRNHVDSAVNELKRILGFIEAEEAQLPRRPRLLPTVYSAEKTSSLLRTVYYAEYILETFLQSRRKGIIDLRTISIAPWTQKQFISKLKKIVKSLKAEFPAHQTPQVSALHRDSRRGLRRNDDDDVFVGRKDDEEKLVSQLIKDDVKSLRVISVVSEEVVGKTTLARKVYNRLDVRQHFQVRAWLHVPEVIEHEDAELHVPEVIEPEVIEHEDAELHVPEAIEHKDLLIAILKQIRTGVLKGVETMNENELSTIVFKNLMELKFLVVLDDVRKLDDWLVFVRPLADAANGSRIIVTTPNSKLASEVDPWSHPLNLKPLKEEDSWKLFKAALAGRPDSAELETMKGKVLKLCHGLPPAIVLLGGSLSTVKLNEWSGVIDHLAHPVLENIIDLSYRMLRSELKLCFLYLALFPKAYEIPVRRLLQLWIAEGFVKMSSTESSVNEGTEASVNKGNESSNKGTEESINEGNQSSNGGTEASVNKGTEPEDMAAHYLEELVCRNMIEIARWKEDGSPKTCRMPSFLHDFSSPMAEQLRFLHANHCKSDCTSADSRSNVIQRLADKCFRIKSTSESHTQTQPQLRRCSSDVSFKVHKQGRSNREVDTLLKTIISKRRGFVLMKVLDLEGAFRPWLPEKLRKLQNLRYIGLRWTSLDSCPESIGDLPFLETLDLKYTNITSLPSSIWKAKNLRHLYMNEVSIKKPKESPMTSNLQTLTGLLIGSEYELNLFTGLRKLGLTCSKSTVENTVECISQLGKLQTFKLRSRDHQFGQPSEIVLPTKLKNHVSLSNLYLFGGVINEGKFNLPPNLKTLTLSMLELKSDSMRVLGQLKQLNILKLFGCSYADNVRCIGEDFPQLRVLKLWRLEELGKWTVQKGAMPKLVELEIRGCEKLEKSDGLKQPMTFFLEGPPLKELSLTNMKREFVEYVKNKLEKSGKSHILLTNDWKPVILP